MASDVDIANMALAHLGDDATVSSFDPAEGSIQAEHCARFYPIARDTCLQAHNWKFAKITVQLTEPLVYAVDGWAFAYALPSNCLKVTQIYDTGGRHDTTNPAEFAVEFETETDPNGQEILLTDVENPYIVYVRQIDDATKFSPMFVMALSYLLASMLAGPVLKGDAGQKANEYWLRVWQVYVGTAAVLDSINQRVKADPVPSNIAARA